MEDPLAQLRDLHAPPPPGFWPPAPGWWAIAGLLLLIALALWFWRRAVQRKRNSLAARASEELSRIELDYQRERNPALLFDQLVTLLRRLAVAKDRSAAGLAGSAWAEYLRARAPAACPEDLWPLIAEDRYRRGFEIPEPALLLDHCRRWLEHNAR